MAQRPPAYVWQGTKAMELIAKVKTHSGSTNISMRVHLSKSYLMAFIRQKWICATGPTEDVQITLCALRSQQEKEPVPAERVILEMELYAWVCCL